MLSDAQADAGIHSTIASVPSREAPLPAVPRTGAQQPFVSLPNPKGQVPITVETQGALSSVASAPEGTAQALLPGDSKVMLGGPISGVCTTLPCYVT